LTRPILPLVLALAVVGCARTNAQANVGPKALATETPTVGYDSWRSTSFGSYLAPQITAADEDGGVDLIFHFHAGQMAEKDWRAANENAVIVSATFGMGTSAYADAFADPMRFERMVNEVLSDLSRRSGRALHPRRVSLFAWSAGFAAVSRILSVPKFYSMVDTVVLLDGLHSNYIDPKIKKSSQGVAQVDVRGLSNFIRFAADAKRGAKEMVLTHSSIRTPDYANSTEANQALLGQVGVPVVPTTPPLSVYGEMKEIERADAGNLHMRGFSGTTAHDHINHLHLIDDVIREFCAPRWREQERTAQKNQI